MINKPTTLFNCLCAGDGLTVTVEKEDLDGILTEPFINIAFWECLIKYRNDKLTFKDRFRIIWYAIRGILPYTDMVSFDVKTAKHFAYHILYLLQKSKKVTAFDITKNVTMTGKQAVEEMKNGELDDLNADWVDRMGSRLND